LNCGLEAVKKLEHVEKMQITVRFSALKLRFKSENQTVKRISIWGLPRAYARGLEFVHLVDLCWTV